MDQLVYKTRKGLEVRTLYPGSVHLASEVTTEERAWYQLSGVDIKCHANQWDLESGQIGSLADIETEMRAKIRDYYIGRVFTALSTVWSLANTPNNFATLGTSITETALKTAIDRINYISGGVKAVFGTKKALTPITVFAPYIPYAADNSKWGVANPAMINDINNNGFVGQYYGAKIVGIDQVFSDPINYTPLYPEDKIIVIGQNVGEFITYGPVKSKQWTNWEPTPPEFMLELYQTFGMVVTNAQGIYVIEVA